MLKTSTVIPKPRTFVLLFIVSFLILNFLSETKLLGNPYVDLRFIPTSNCLENDLYCVTVQIKGEEGAAYIGISSIRIEYDDAVLSFSNNASLSNPNGTSMNPIGTFTSIHFDGDQNSMHPDCQNGLGYDPYGMISFDGLVPGDILATIVLLSPTNSSGAPIFACPSIEGQWIDVFEICFEVLDTDANPNLAFVGIQNGDPLGNPAGTIFSNHFNNPDDKYWNGFLEPLELTYHEVCGLDGIFFGCTDPLACNYDPVATEELGNCIYATTECACGETFGCTDPTADNYNEIADCDDGSCSYLTTDCDPILYTIAPSQPFEICIQGDDLCSLSENFELTHVGSIFDCNLSILNDTCLSYIPFPYTTEDFIFAVVCSTDNPLICEWVMIDIDVSVNAVINNPPITQNDFGTTDINTAISIDLIANDLDLENDTSLIFNLLGSDGQASNGSVVFFPDGTITYTPNPGFTGFDEFTYTITDSEGALDQGLVTIGVGEDVCNPNFSACIEPLSFYNQGPSFFCVSFCQGGLEIIEDGLSSTLYDCGLTIDDYNPNCFYYTPPWDFIGNEIVEVIACHPISGMCDTASVVINTTVDIANCVEIENIPLNLDCPTSDFVAPVLDLLCSGDSLIFPTDFNIIDPDSTQSGGMAWLDDYGIWITEEPQIQFGCAPSDVTTVYATIACDDDLYGQIDEYITVAIHQYQTYPEVQTPTISFTSIDVDGSCIYTLTPACPNDVLSFNTITIDSGAPGGVLSVEVFSGIAGSPCSSQEFELIYDACQGTVSMGCTDSCALNYDENVVLDDGSCQYPDVDDGCPLTVDSFDSVLCVVINLEPDPNDDCPLTIDSYDAINCLIVNEAPSCDDDDPNTEDTFNPLSCDCQNLPIIVEGCTNPCAPNYDATAINDDGSCQEYDDTCDTDFCNNGGAYVWDATTCSCILDVEVILGCTDPTACNYNEEANCDDDGCDFGNINCTNSCDAVLGCLDPEAENYDPLADCDFGIDCVMVSIETLTFEPISIFPNPVSDFVVFRYKSLEESTSLYFYNMVGKIVKIESLSIASQEQTVSIQDFPSGIYFWEVNGLSGKLMVK